MKFLSPKVGISVAALLLMGGGCISLPGTTEEERATRPIDVQVEVGGAPVIVEDNNAMPVIDADELAAQMNMPTHVDTSGDGVSGEMVTNSESVSDTITSAPDGPEVHVVNVIAKSWEFVPAEIHVNLGDTVRLDVLSVDIDHGIRLPAFGIDENLMPGETTSIEFVADQAGSHSFSCDVFCGEGHGDMKGTLIVE